MREEAGGGEVYRASGRKSGSSAGPPAASEDTVADVSREDTSVFAAGKEAESCCLGCSCPRRAVERVGRGGEGKRGRAEGGLATAFDRGQQVLFEELLFRVERRRREVFSVPLSHFLSCGGLRERQKRRGGGTAEPAPGTDVSSTRLRWRPPLRQCQPLARVFPGGRSWPDRS